MILLIKEIIFKFWKKISACGTGAVRLDGGINCGTGAVRLDGGINCGTGAVRLDGGINCGTGSLRLDGGINCGLGLPGAFWPPSSTSPATPAVGC